MCQSTANHLLHLVTVILIYTNRLGLAAVDAVSASYSDDTVILANLNAFGCLPVEHTHSLSCRSKCMGLTVLP